MGDDNLFMFVFVVEWNFSSACKTGLLAKSTHSHRLIIAPTSAMARLLIAVLAATTVSAFKTPKSRALKVRGGIDIHGSSFGPNGEAGPQSISSSSKPGASLPNIVRPAARSRWAF